jgi:hypothetical protein
MLRIGELAENLMDPGKSIELTMNKPYSYLKLSKFEVFAFKILWFECNYKLNLSKH